MRDPDLVQRAERAAFALERAWGHWRVMHGLGTDPLPPVSSYVGYSLEEPWGQPRVVFGVGADEAERLAALLAGHDCVGPVHAEVTARPDWRLAASSTPATGQGRAFDGAVNVPAQAPRPAAGPVTEQDAWYGPPLAAGAAVGTVESGTVESGTVEADAGEAGIREVGTVGAGDAGPQDADAGDSGQMADGVGRTATGGTAASHGKASHPVTSQAESADSPARAIPAPPADAVLAAEPGARSLRQPRRASRPEAAEESSGQDRPASGSWQHGEPAGAFQPADAEQPGVIPFRRPGQPAAQPEDSAGYAGSDGDDAVPTQGPGYGGPRYQGVPPQYQPGLGRPEGREELAARRADAEADRPTGASAPGAERPGAEPSGEARSDSERSGAERPGAARSDGARSGAERSCAEPSGEARSDSERSGAERSDGARADPERPDVVQTGGRQSGAGQSGAGQADARRPGGGQPGGGQSAAGQSRQASRPGRSARAVGRESGKRPRG